VKRGLAGFTAQDFDHGAYLPRIDAQAVLDHYGAENIREERNAEDGSAEIIHSCLIDRVIPHHANGDANPSASCNLDRKVYVCYSYVDPETGKSGMDLIDLILLLEGKKGRPSEALETINRFLLGATQEADDFREKLLARMAAPAPGAARITAQSRRVLVPWARTHPYVVERGIDLSTASRLQIGYDETTNRITIPHFWNGDLVGWQKRAIPDRPGQWPGTAHPVPKYRSSPGFPKSETLYRYDEAVLDAGGACVVVESPFSCIKAVALGLSTPVVATFGAKISDTQIDLLRRSFDRVYVWMDDDDAGYAASKRLTARLFGHVEVKVVDPDPGMDLADYDTAQSVQAKLDVAIPGWIKMADNNREKAWAQRRSVSERSRPARR